MTTLERLDALIERGVFYDCDWDTLKKARSELAMSDYGKWQPIETAPKDGTRILAKDRNGWREMWWVICGTDYADYWQDEFDSEPEPTLWARLPVPPVEGE